MTDLTRDEDVDIGGVLSAIWARKGLILLVALVATALAFAVLQVVDPRYRAQSDVLIQRADAVFESSRSDEALRSATSLDEQGIQSQVAILKSAGLAREVVEKLDLARREEFDPTRAGSPVAGLKRLLGMDAPRATGSSTERALEAFFERLKVYQADRARVVTVEFSSTDPALSAAVPNAIIEAYLAKQKGFKRGAGSDPEQLATLGAELSTIRQRLAQAEQAVAQFRAQSDILQGRDNATLATQELSDISAELGRIRSQRARDEARAAQIERALRSGSLATAPGVAQAPLFQRLRERQVALRSDIAELSSRLLDDHPRIRALRSQLATLDEQIEQEARNILESLQQDASLARAREQTLLAQRDDAKDEASRVDGAQVRLGELEREAAAQREIYNSYLIRFNEAQSRATREFLPADAVVISTAQAPAEPYFPKTGPVLAGTFAGSLLLAMLGVLVAHLGSSNPVRQPKPMSEMAKRDVPDASAALASVTAGDGERAVVEPVPPIAPKVADLSPVVNENSAAMTARSLALFGTGRILVLSPGDEATGQGSLALARQLSSIGSSTVLVDLSGGGYVANAVEGLPGAIGLRDLAAGVALTEEALHGDPRSELHILPAGEADLVDANRFRTVLEQLLSALDDTYDFVVIEAGRAGVEALPTITHARTVVVLDAPDGENRVTKDANALLATQGYDTALILTIDPEERSRVFSPA